MTRHCDDDMFVIRLISFICFDLLFLFFFRDWLNNLITFTYTFWSIGFILFYFVFFCFFLTEILFSHYTEIDWLPSSRCDNVNDTRTANKDKRWWIVRNVQLSCFPFFSGCDAKTIVAKVLSIILLFIGEYRPIRRIVCPITSHFSNWNHCVCVCIFEIMWKMLLRQTLFIEKLCLARSSGQRWKLNIK